MPRSHRASGHGRSRGRAHGVVACVGMWGAGVLLALSGRGDELTGYSWPCCSWLLPAGTGCFRSKQTARWPLAHSWLAGGHHQGTGASCLSPSHAGLLRGPLLAPSHGRSQGTLWGGIPCVCPSNGGGGAWGPPQPPPLLSVHPKSWHRCSTLHGRGSFWGDASGSPMFCLTGGQPHGAVNARWGDSPTLGSWLHSRGRGQQAHHAML